MKTNRLLILVSLALAPLLVWAQLWEYSGNGNEIRNTNGGDVRLNDNSFLIARGHVFFYPYEGENNSGTVYLQARQSAANTGTSINFQLRTQNAGQVVEAFQIRADGNVGIGTTNPAAKLEVRGGATAIDYLHVNPENSAGEGGEISLKGSSGNPNWQLDVFHNRFRIHSSGAERFTITSDGSVGIGTNTPGNFRLAVEGLSGAREIQVRVGSWSDFVFQKNYRLPALSEVESYIRRHRHLPDIPTEAAVKTEGIAVGEMSAKLLQKIEELTLYVIALEKRSKAQARRINALERYQNHLPKPIRR